MTAELRAIQERASQALAGVQKLIEERNHLKQAVEAKQNELGELQAKMNDAVSAAESSAKEDQSKSEAISTLKQEIDQLSEESARKTEASAAETAKLQGQLKTAQAQVRTARMRSRKLQDTIRSLRLAQRNKTLDAKKINQVMETELESLREAHAEDLQAVDSVLGKLAPLVEV